MKKIFTVLTIITLIFSSRFICAMNNSLIAKEELTQHFNQLPTELQYEVRRLQLMRNALIFLDSTTLTDNSNSIDVVATNGVKVATRSDNNTAKVWDITTSKLLHTLQGHTGKITSIAMNADKVVTVSEDRTAKIWDINTGKELYTLKGHTAEVKSVEINGNKIITGSNDNSAKIWDIDTGKLLYTLGGYEVIPDFTKDENFDPINRVVTSGNKIITKSVDGTIKIWDITTGKLLHIVGQFESTKLIAIHDEKMALVTVSEDNEALICNINTGELLHILTDSDCINAIAINSDKVVTASWTTAKVWDIHTGQLLYTLKGHDRMIESVAINGGKVVTASGDAAKIWSLSHLQGTSKNNHLAWIINYADPLQADFIKRAYEEKRSLPIVLPKKFEELKRIEETDSQAQADAKIYFSFDAAVREYLRDHLKICNK